MLKILKCSFSSLICGTILCAWLTAESLAYQLTWKDLLHYVLQENRKWDHVFLTTKVHVYDPFAQQEETQSAQEPHQVPTLGYRQNVYWTINDLLVVETFSNEGALLHFYYESKGDVISVTTQTKRFFSTMDILPHYLRFVVHRSKDWERALQEVNIQGKEISLAHDNNYNIFYRVGEAQGDHFALIDKETFFLRRLHYSIQAGEQEHLIRIVFQDMTRYKKLEFPKQTDYFLKASQFSSCFLHIWIF